MLRLAVDEDFNQRVVRGLRQRHQALDIVRVQEAGLSGAPDPEVLEWAAREGRPLLTHDLATMTEFAYERVQQGLPMLGVFGISQGLPIGPVIEEILLIAECSFEGEWEGQIRYLPLR